ncbi:hypothetical protein AVEN_21148-1 [Araneus ventricosus]|uniref:Uncharacterized protein n=1 Tax=Araneus ventricosus TaxID=182803 RepID=A0A4Y2I8P5_ARAVE|nr:hypothetical protein AVEN_21148-1 [Araneus ventricosus]
MLVKEVTYNMNDKVSICTLIPNTIVVHNLQLFYLTIERYIKEYYVLNYNSQPQVLLCCLIVAGVVALGGMGDVRLEFFLLAVHPRREGIPLYPAKA